jgi:hypothetical protein
LLPPDRRRHEGRELIGLVEERKREAVDLAALQAERAGVAAKGRQIETETALNRYVVGD